jgi:hypothetical protein
MGTVMSIIEGGVFLIVGSLGTMRVLVSTRMPSSGGQESDITVKEWESSSEVHKDIPLLSIDPLPKHIALDSIRPMGPRIASYDFCQTSEIT